MCEVIETDLIEINGPQHPEHGRPIPVCLADLDPLQRAMKPKPPGQRSCM
jgi:hypothetical protein